jgi:hypothetical protein
VDYSLQTPERWIFQNIKKIADNRNAAGRCQPVRALGKFGLHFKPEALPSG